LKPLKSLKTYVLGTLVISGGLIAAGVGFQSSHVNLKLADPNEPPSRITMAPAAKVAMPAVVKISASKVVKAQAQQMDPMLRQFFGNQFGGNFEAPRSHREGGLGSGVVISPDGYIITNNHVVDGATDVKVTLPDRREYKAKVIGTDPKTDVAVLKIDASNLPVLTIGNSSKLQVGDGVLAIGNPYGVGQTVTMGIVSATGRTGLGIEDYEDFIKTDASINPGNSGGALVNDRGELIGINTAILAPGSGGNQGIGFAVPVNLVRQVMDQIVTHGKVDRASLGVMVQEVTPAIAKAMHLDGPKGALVSQVMPDSAAQKAGVQTGDVILEINGTPIVESNQLRMAISMMNPAQSVNLKVFRDGHNVNLTAKLGEMQDKKKGERASNDSADSDKTLTGVSVEDLNAQTARQLGLPASTKGVVVTEVDPGSQAAASGLKEGDVIQEVNRQAVTNAQDFNRAVKKSEGESLLLVNRGGNKIFLAV
jgi:serine protease Do